MENIKMKIYLTQRLASAFAAALLGFASLSAMGSDAAKPMNQASGAEVKIDNFTFSAPTITVAAGTQVTWTNRDDMPHTIASDDKLFKSKALDTDEKFSFTFSTPGTYHYFCSIHPKMTGEVVVK
jgi:plastocyanin